MNRITMPNVSHITRTGLAENLALSFAFPIGLVFAVIWGLIFHSLQSNSITLSGWPSIGLGVLIDAGVIVFIGFILGYLRGQKALQPHEQLKLSKPKFIFDCLALTSAYTIIAVALTAVILTGINVAFKDVRMTDFSAALVVGIFATFTTYSIISTSVRLQSKDIVHALTLFITGGVFISMATAKNPLWWQINFSSLGTSGTISAYSFNITLVLSGLLLLCLTDYLLSDLQQVVKGNTATITKRTNTIKLLFVGISASLAGVGLFPWDIHPLLHTSSAYLLVVVFSILIIGLHKLVPNLSKSFFANSYGILVILVACFIMWQPFRYFNQTAFELIAFCLIFIWLVLFLRTITNLKNSLVA
ncbi:hypothetical protein H0W80_01915 [Candidatus Saccharibacteria bacterium]|nr:hypothetical protein [Candidatus Saccharibacteria bacterium]